MKAAADPYVTNGYFYFQDPVAALASSVRSHSNVATVASSVRLRPEELAAYSAASAASNNDIGVSASRFENCVVEATPPLMVTSTRG